MSTPLLNRLYNDASADTGLLALLTTSPFPWYIGTPPQGFQMPAVATFLISDPATYSIKRRLRTSYARVQINIWGGQYAPGVAARDAVDAAIAAFMDTWLGGCGSPATWITQAPNRRVGARDFEYVQTDTPIFQRIVDYLIFNDETL